MFNPFPKFIPDPEAEFVLQDALTAKEQEIQTLNLKIATLEQETDRLNREWKQALNELQFLGEKCNEKQLTIERLKQENYSLRLGEQIQSQELARVKRKIQEVDEKSKQYFLNWNEQQIENYKLKDELSVVPGWVCWIFQKIDQLFLGLS